MSDFDWDEFEAAIRLLKSGVDKLPFRDVIKAATGHNILPFNDSTRAVVRKLDEWISVNVQHLSNHIESEYIGRPNELGNYLERILLNDFQRDLAPSIRCEMPRTISGHAQAVGYPDGVIFTQNEVMYFDVKIYQAKTKDTTLRSFYYQPTNQSKIHHDAPHFLIGFEVESIDGNNSSPFRIVDYSIVDVYDMNVNFKAEFNTNNRNIYNLERP
tara:strand:- start:219 stop:860 length:642 start_codon:yes stop_codon:yes gene_type:complete